MSNQENGSASRSPLPDSIHFLVPFWGLAGGIIKILDYAIHARELGIEATVWAPPLPESSNPVHELPALQRLLDDPEVDFRDLDELADLSTSTTPPTILFSEPTHYPLIEQALEEPLGPRLIHLVQNTRHANPRWLSGVNYRLLHRPMTRIAVATQVFDAVAPLVNNRYELTAIVEGHDTAYFADRPKARNAPSEAPLRVLYATWKSDLGDRVAAELADDERFRFIAIREPTGWPTLRNRYHGADIFLCAPSPQEGFYIPGLEAMAAEVAVVTALVGGNEAYVDPGVNAVVADFDDAVSHAEALVELAENPERRQALIDAGQATLENHTLARERSEFESLLRALAGSNLDP